MFPVNFRGGQAAVTKCYYGPGNVQTLFKYEANGEEKRTDPGKKYEAPQGAEGATKIACGKMRL